MGALRKYGIAVAFWLSVAFILFAWAMSVLGK